MKRNMTKLVNMHLSWNGKPRIWRNAFVATNTTQAYLKSFNVLKVMMLKIFRNQENIVCNDFLNFEDNNIPSNNVLISVFHGLFDKNCLTSNFQVLELSTSFRQTQNPPPFDHGCHKDFRQESVLSSKPITWFT